MNPPLAAKYYADSACFERTHIVQQERLARDTYRVRVAAPAIAPRILPGQFIMLRLAGRDDPLLGRPLALYDVASGDDGRPAMIDVVYLVVGKLTRRLSLAAVGDAVEIWGPLGNGFAPGQCQRLIMVAGGIGQTPFLALAQERLGKARYGDPPRAASPVEQITLCYGARSQDLLAGVADFAAAGVDVRLCTDDGSAGRRGLVTMLLEEALAEGDGVHVVCCGPEPMMEAVAGVCEREGVSCEVSLETPMACGLGICFSCVAKVKQPDGQWDYKRTCVDGPVFPSEQIVW